MKAVLALVRRLATLPVLRRLTRVDLLMRVSFALRASLVTEPRRFVRNELRRSRVTATYRVRESGLAVTIRHHSPDVLVLDEVFSQREYNLPDIARLRLAERRHVRVADLGANIGLFGVWILGWFPQAQIVALEPDPSNARIHRLTIEANERALTWRLIEAGAATEAATLRFAVGSFTTSHVAGPREAGIEVEGVDVFPLLEGVDLVKMDIEGAEWPILRDSRFRDLEAQVIVLEYHPESPAQADPAGVAVGLLAEAGYAVEAHHQKQEGIGLLWALSSP